MSKLQAFDNEKEPLERNRLLFSWLCDDQLRRELYEELESNNFPVLQFKSLLRSRNNGEWTYEDVYFLSKKEDLETALKYYSVEPYQALDSGGKFMLGLDDVRLHGDQRKVAEWAIGITGNKHRHVSSSWRERKGRRTRTPLHERRDQRVRARSLSPSCGSAAEPCQPGR